MQEQTRRFLNGMGNCSLPEDGVQNNGENDDSPTEYLGAGGCLHLNKALIGKNHSLTTLEVVDEGEDSTHNAHGDEGEGHAVKEAHVRGAKDGNPLEGGVEYGAEQNTQPTEDAGALGNEETEQELEKYYK